MTTASVDAAVPVLERASPGLVQELKSYVVRHRGEVEAMIRAGENRTPATSPANVTPKFSTGCLCSLFHATQATLTREGAWRPVSLAAVGSYGRSTLAFASDLDVRILCEKDLDGARPVAEALLYPLWDSGLSIGHQVVTPSEMVELARTDLPTATGLLDWRVVAGDTQPTPAHARSRVRGRFRRRATSESSWSCSKSA